MYNSLMKNEHNDNILHAIHQSNLIEGINNADADADSCEAWAYLLDQPKLTNKVICNAQRIITNHQDDLSDLELGYYRSHNGTQVTVGGVLCPSPKLVEGLMDNWLLDYPTLAPKEAHIRFEKIHPFVDGNGRTGRMLMWWMQRKRGQPITVIEFLEREEYYKWFKHGEPQT